MRAVDPRLQVPWSEQVTAGSRRRDPAIERPRAASEHTLLTEDWVTTTVDADHDDDQLDRATYDDISGL